MAHHSRTRVLVWGLSNNRAGTEKVIETYVQHLPNVAFDFLCYEKPKNYSHLFDKGFNNRFFLIPIKIKEPLKYFSALRNFYKIHANDYYALWFNANDLSNIDPLIEAERYGIPIRIIHSHNSGIQNKVITRLFSSINKPLLKKYANRYWACSSEAGQYMFRNIPFRIIPNLIDSKLNQFDSLKRKKIRSRYKINDSCLLIGTVGRLCEQKNHKFLIDLLPLIVKKNPNVCLMIVGDGSLKNDLKKHAITNQVERNIIFTGAQDDPQAFLSAFDIFAFPSLYEGLGIALLEAQFNNLPCIVSERIKDEAIISKNVKKINLSDIKSWLAAILSSKREDNVLIKEKALKFDIENFNNIASNLFI